MKDTAAVWRIMQNYFRQESRNVFCQVQHMDLQILSHGTHCFITIFEFEKGGILRAKSQKVFIAYEECSIRDGIPLDLFHLNSIPKPCLWRDKGV